jgi:imidazole glycerol phosphate synthase subunit HisF
MPSKRVVAMLWVRNGRIVAPEDGADLGAPSPWARRLEMEGADEVLFVERGAGGGARRPWLAAVAGGLFIPFALEADFQSTEDLAGALEDGADRVVVAARTFRDLQADRFGRARVAAALDARPGDVWREALDAMADLNQAGAGEILLRAGTEDLEALSRQTIRLPMPVLLHCPDPLLAAEALAHGADGIVYPAGLRTASDFKALLQPAGVPLRR